jgi:hypothetical protein
MQFNAVPIKSTIPSAACFHTTSWVGRKSGSMALEPKARPPSKKQMKRKAREIKREATIVDSKTDQLKTTHIGEQFHSEEMEYFMEDVRERYGTNSRSSISAETHALTTKLFSTGSSNRSLR